MKPLFILLLLAAVLASGCAHQEKMAPCDHPGVKAQAASISDDDCIPRPVNRPVLET